MITSRTASGLHVREVADMPFEPLTPERRRAMTRQHLLDAAAIVFARDGFHGASIENFRSSERALMTRWKYSADPDPWDHGAMAPSLIDRSTDPTETTDELQRMGDFAWRAMNNDDWTLLYLEFLVYAARNPEAKAKLAESARQSRRIVAEMRKNEFSEGDGPLDVEEFATISLAVFFGLEIDHLIDPDSVTKQTLVKAMTLFSRTADPSV